MPDQLECRRCRTGHRRDILERLGGFCPRCLEALVFSAGDASEPPVLTPGARFRDLEILEIVGRGGMGVVYRAKQTTLDRVVAVKVIAPRFADDEEFAARFAGEAKLLAALSHPNIVPIHEAGEEEGRWFLVMEFVEGRSVRDLLRNGPLGPDEALRITSQVCIALQYAHDHGVVHRDIKPENILITPDGMVKIADFGLAKALSRETADTQSGVVMGTRDYMAPERLRTGTADPRSDIYAVGVVLYELLTGRLPKGPLHSKHRRVDRIVAKALNQDPAGRYQTATEMLGELADATRPASKKPILIGLICVALGSGVLALSLKAPSASPKGRVGQNLLAEMEGWSWERPVPGCSIRDGVAEVGPYADGPLIQLSTSESLDGSFRLGFQVAYEIEQRQEPWILVLIGEGGIVLFPRGDHSLAVAQTDRSGSFGLLGRRPLPVESMEPGAWATVEVGWDDASRVMRVSVDGKVAMAEVLAPEVVLRGPWKFGFGGAARRVRIREVRKEVTSSAPREM